MTGTSGDRRHEGGFTLIEALVAMLILAIASAGLLGAVETHVDTIGKLEARTAALWVAENRLAELQLGQAAGVADTVRMLDRDWRVTVRQGASQDPDLRQVTISVAMPGGGTPIVTLRGFVDAGTVTT